MGKRTNTAVWLDKYGRWQIKVQKDGQRRTFTSSKPGRTGQREANRKADAWLDDGIEDQRQRVGQVYPRFLEEKKQTTSRSNWEPMESRWRNHIRPVLCNKTVAALSEQDLQTVINKAFARSGLSHKSLCSLRADLVAFVKYCRKARLLTLLPESLTIPTTAAKPEKTILQPRDFVVLFNTDQTSYRGKVVKDDLIHAYRLAVLTGNVARSGCVVKTAGVDERLFVFRGRARVYESQEQVVELSALARLELAAQREENGPVKPEAPVFDIPSDKYFEAHLTRFCACNGLPTCTPYELRHTFVSIAKVLPAGLVKSLVGHSQDMDTFGVYGHELEDDTARRADALDGMFARLLGG